MRYLFSKDLVAHLSNSPRSIDCFLLEVEDHHNYSFDTSAHIYLCGSVMATPAIDAIISFANFLHTKE